MKEICFKLPIYWHNLWSGLEHEKIGLIVKSVFEFVMHGTTDCPFDPTEKAFAVWRICLDDIKYQMEHPYSYKKPENVREIRNCKEYRQWRAAVYERDHYTCQNCGRVGGTINAHHIKPFSKYPEYRFDVNNGITLCEECHKLAHKRGFRYAE